MKEGNYLNLKQQKRIRQSRSLDVARNVSDETKGSIKEEQEAAPIFSKPQTITGNIDATRRTSADSSLRLEHNDETKSSTPARSNKSATTARTGMEQRIDSARRMSEIQIPPKPQKPSFLQPQLSKIISTTGSIPPNDSGKFLIVYMYTVPN